MVRRLHSLLRRAVHVEPAELPSLLWLFAYFFCVLSGYYLLRPVRDEMGIQAGLGRLQWLFTATFIVMLLAVPAYGWLSGRFPRRRFLPVVYLFFASHLIVFFVLFRQQVAVRETAMAFFVWVSVFNLFVVSVFWSFMADLWSERQARRLFGVIAAGGSCGAIAGPLLAAGVAPLAGPATLLPMSAVLMLAAVLCMRRLLRLSGTGRERDGQAVDAPLGGSVFAGLSLTLRSPYLLGIALFTVLQTVLATFLYFMQAHIVSEAIAAPGERTALFAMLDLAVNALTLLGQLFVVQRLVERFGIGPVLALQPAFAAGAFLLLMLFPVLGVLVAVQVIQRAAGHAITRPAREMLFTVVSREAKYKAKNVTDTVVYRGGDAASGWLFEGLRAIGLGLGGIAALAVPVAVAWGLTGWTLGRACERRADPPSLTGREHAAQ